MVLAQVDIFRQNTDTEKLSFENVDLEQMTRVLDLESSLSWKQKEEGKQKTFV